MLLKLKPSLLVMALSILFYSCQKEYSLEGNVVGGGTGGTAVFTLSGAPGTCTNAVVGGTYQAGTALGAANIITLAVNVTTVGTFTINTATANGISFTGAGIFSSTGPQTIVLMGSGTPVSAGTFPFTPGNNGCTFSVIVASGGGGSGGTAAYTFNGAPGNCTGFTPGGTYSAGTALGAGNFVTVTVNVTTLGTFIITTNTVNGITFSANGTFTATGPQAVQLSGSGTPLAAGTFNYTPTSNGCAFPITVTGNASTSVFTYTGAPGTCTTATPAGVFTAGTPLTAANTVSVGVNVTTIGTYAISTAAVNGISFAGSGSFAATGPQTVVLTGTGTPTIAGPFNYTPTGNGCSFSVTTAPGAVVTDFLQCTIDGVPKTFNVNVMGAQVTADTFDIGGDESIAGNTAIFGIEIVKSPAITVGTYNRYTLTNTSTFCLAGYLDGVSPNPWLTGVSPLSQPFSVIVTSFTANRIAGTFSGTIYSDPIGSTGPKVITAGSFSVAY